MIAIHDTQQIKAGIGRVIFRIPPKPTSTTGNVLLPESNSTDAFTWCELLADENTPYNPGVSRIDDTYIMIIRANIIPFKWQGQEFGTMPVQQIIAYAQP